MSTQIKLPVYPDTLNNKKNQKLVSLCAPSIDILANESNLLDSLML